MPDWLTLALPTAADAPAAALVANSIRAAALGAAVAGVYFLTQRKRRAEAAPFVATLVLLTVLIAMVTRVIGENLARAFGLAGALSIIRFRTVVDDTRDTAFVIWAVVTGMAVGSDLTPVAVAGFPVAAVVAAVLSLWGRGPAGRNGTGTLVIRVGVGSDPSGLLAVPMSKLLDDVRLVAVTTARQGAAVDLTYAARLRPGGTVLGLIAELGRVEGVQAVEWKETGGAG